MAHRWVRALSLCFFSLIPIVFLSSLVTGCGGGTTAETTPAPPSNPTTPTTPPAAAPAVSSVARATVAAGSAAFTLQINGSGFVSGSAASWNGTNLTTTYVAAT